MAKIDNFRNLFSPSKEQLQKAGWREAGNRFNVVMRDGTNYITYMGRIISIPTDDTCDSSTPLLERLQALRIEFVNEYMEREGRL